MTSTSIIFPAEAILVRRKFFQNAGQFNFAVPAGANFLRAIAQGCGGQGENYGGSGAYALSRVPVTPAENLKIQVGNTSTQSANGDSWVRRNDNSIIVYADRGRGNSDAGKAALSQGDVKRDGQAGVNNQGRGGLPPSDANDFGALGFSGYAIRNPRDDINYGSPGGGGVLGAIFDEFNNLQFFIAPNGGGCGLVALEFFNTDPGY